MTSVNDLSREQVDIDPDAEATASCPEERNTLRDFVDLLRVVLVFLVLFWGIKTFVVEGYEVQGDSMAPTLLDGERILVFKLPMQLTRLSLFSEIVPFREGDIIVFDGADNKRYVKRVVAAHPERRSNTVNARTRDDASDDVVRVEYDHGKLRVNNWQVEEPYLPERERESPDWDLCLLKPGECYVLGDHRSMSKDSRSFRAVPDDRIVGKAVFRFWPLSRFGRVR